MKSQERFAGVAAALSAYALLFAACSTPTAPTGGAVAANGLAATERIVQAIGSPEDFMARGWECRRPPIPGRVSCSPPNQGFPAIPPPADRPASYQFKVWQDGVYAGNILLIRPDLYQGQACESTGAPYVYLPVIGYYECLHTVGS